MFFKARYHDKFPQGSSLVPSEVFRDELSLEKARSIYIDTSLAYGLMETLVLEKLIPAPAPRIEEVMDKDITDSEETPTINAATSTSLVLASTTPHKLVPRKTASTQQHQAQILTLKQGHQFALSRLQDLGFVLSSSQMETPADGNCLFHALMDQMR